MSSQFIKASKNPFQDVGFDEIQARDLQFRSYLMDTLARYIQHHQLTQKQAAEKLGVSQPRISNLLHGKIELFGAGMLMNMLERAGFRIFDDIMGSIQRNPQIKKVVQSTEK